MEEETIEHNELVKMIFKEYSSLVKSKIIAQFLSSFNSQKIKFRSGLPVFAILQSFPKHEFILRDGQEMDDTTPCAICSNYPKIDVDLELAEEFYQDLGGLVGFQLEDFWYYLSATNKLEEVNPTKTDISIFSEIIFIINSANDEDTVKKNVQKQISKIKGFKSDAEQRKSLLETLGYCSILETSEHQGLLKKYINLAVAPSKTHSSDWYYPVDWWLGKDGINKDAFKFWFGNYSELEKFWK
ncbi:hypothetical protein [uncultured Winogradskyella sp.]|uniref:hypothetical protein n=1 Tax=uncultured Winogradskyella sp. TaxID=395353 RepID=UPI00261882D4|nr:hypothetical protein [uncultured Winogradskyella sp.]